MERPGRAREDGAESAGRPGVDLLRHLAPGDPLDQPENGGDDLDRTLKDSPDETEQGVPRHDQHGDRLLGDLLVVGRERKRAFVVVFAAGQDGRARGPGGGRARLVRLGGDGGCGKAHGRTKPWEGWAVTGRGRQTGRARSGAGGASRWKRGGRQGESRLNLYLCQDMLYIRSGPLSCALCPRPPPRLAPPARPLGAARPVATAARRSRSPRGKTRSSTGSTGFSERPWARRGVRRRILVPASRRPLSPAGRPARRSPRGKRRRRPRGSASW